MLNMNPTLPRWLDPKPIPATKLAQRPSMEFERGLEEWERIRSHELATPSRVSYEYYVRQHATDMKGLDYSFSLGENTRQAIRDGDADPDDPWVYAYNSEPHKIIARIALGFGWRVVPYARYVSVCCRDQSFAHDVESAVRAWNTKADAIWDILIRMPKSKRNSESHRALVQPIRNEARVLEDRVGEMGEMLLAS